MTFYLKNLEISCRFSIRYGKITYVFVTVINH